MRTIFLAVTGVSIAVTACSDSGTSVEVVQKTPVASVVISLPTSPLIVGQTAQGSAVARDATGLTLPDRVITWRSSNTGIARVDGAGTIAAVAAGNASISAESEGVSSAASLTVMDAPPAPVASVSVALTSGAINPGQTTQATATLRDSNNNTLSGRTVTWASSNSAIATVNGSGVVSAVAEGSAQITATSESQSGSATLSVTATPPPAVATVAVTLGSSTLNPGQTTQATATLRDANNNVLTGRTISWSSSNQSLATVSASGVVTAVAAGSVQITATSETKSGSATLTVAAPPPAPVASVTVTLAASSRNPGQTTQATAVLRDANNNVLTGRSIIWSSSDNGVATVSSSGLVTAIAVGTASIIASCEGQNGNAILTVTAAAPPPVASVSVALANSTLVPGATTQATATTRDANNNILTGRAIAWSSGNDAIATVSQSGLVTAVAAGDVQIIATSEGQIGSAALAVQLSAPPPSGTNEPTGMTLVFDRPFNRQFEAGWSDEFSSNMSFISDPTAPKSPSGILRATYPTGYTSAGVGPGGADAPLPSGLRTVYVSYWGRFSSNWYGHDSGVNKEFYLWGNGTPYVVFTARCQYTGPITPDIGLQAMAVGGDYDISPNLVPNAHVTRGQWFHIELVAVGNSANTSDGSLDWWLDGVHIGSYKNLRFSNAAVHWDMFHYTTIWGGVGGPNVPATQTKDWDHAYLSGKN